MKRPNKRPQRRKQRQAEAIERQTAYDALSLPTKVARAHRRGGECREFVRLVKQMEVSNGAA